MVLIPPAGADQPRERLSIDSEVSISTAILPSPLIPKSGLKRERIYTVQNHDWVDDLSSLDVMIDHRAPLSIEEEYWSFMDGKMKKFDVACVESHRISISGVVR